MKALELTVYPMWDNGFGEMYADKDDPTRPVSVDFEVYRKRLTDTELAAEYWAEYSVYLREASNLLHCQERYMEAAGKSFQEEQLKCSALHRFATLPHYDEPTTTTGAPQ